KRVRKLPFIILFILIILIVIIAYIVHGYNSGVKYAEKHAKDIKVHEFNGPVKNDGKISVLVLGADKAQGGKSRTDSIMVVQY
ncbi:LytR family transcriptional regulator, partial [Staphylococcus epidermidis]